MTWLLWIFAKEATGSIASPLNVEATEESRGPASGGQEHGSTPGGHLFQRPFFFGYFSFWAVQKESNPAAVLADGTPNAVRQIALNPQAKAAEQAPLYKAQSEVTWIPAFAGMTA